MTINYQLVILGNTHPMIDAILQTLNNHLEELGVEKAHVRLLNESNFNNDYKGNSPTFCLYFGDSMGNFKHLDLVSRLISDGSLILPIVDNITNFNASIPEKLHKINGYQLADSSGIEALVSVILEGFGLERKSRRLFISYKRDESSAVAIQLYELLEKNGFDVFLDTHSIRPAEPFQDELWHRLADTDIVVLLNTPRFLTSFWTRDELARANAMQIGILQLVWPNHTMENTAAISIPIHLNDTDFVNNTYGDSKSILAENIMKTIVEKAESLRARTLAARQDNIITEFMKAANKVGKAADLHPRKIIQTKTKTGEDILVIPAIGVPQSLTFHESEGLASTLNLANKPKVFLLYDHIYIRDKWVKHLDWLDGQLSIKGVKVINAEKWLQNI